MPVNAEHIASFKQWRQNLSKDDPLVHHDNAVASGHSAQTDHAAQVLA